MTYRSDGHIQVQTGVLTEEKGRFLCDILVKAIFILRAELCDTQEGEIVYARGHRPATQRWFDIKTHCYLEPEDKPDPMLILGKFFPMTPQQYDWEEEV